MNTEEFIELGQTLFPGNYWQAQLAELLDVTPRTVYRWADDKEPQTMSEERYMPVVIAFTKLRKAEMDGLLYKLEGYKIEN